MASAIYNIYKKEMGSIDWSDNSTTTFKVMLLDDTYSVDIDAHHYLSDIDALSVEVSGTNYTAGGAEVLNRTVTSDDVNDWAKYDADDVVWANSTITARYGILYLSTGTPATSTLLCMIDFVTDKLSVDGDFTIQWHADGAFRIG